MEIKRNDCLICLDRKLQYGSEQGFRGSSTQKIKETGKKDTVL